MMKKEKCPKQRGWMVVMILLSLVLILGGCGKKEENPSTPEGPGVETPTGEEENPLEEMEEAEKENPIGEELSEGELAALYKDGKAMDEFFYEMSVSGMGMPASITRMYTKGGLMRMESEVMGTTYVMIYEEEAFYTLDPSTKTAMKMPLTMEEDTEVLTLDEFTQDVDETRFGYLGKESLRGITCHVVETKDEVEGITMKMWLHEDYGFPMKIETTMAEGGTSVMDVTDFQVGGLSDALFEVPEDYAVTDLMNLLPSAP